jgi:hypothetical protein
MSGPRRYENGEDATDDFDVMGDVGGEDEQEWEPSDDSGGDEEFEDSDETELELDEEGEQEGEEGDEGEGEDEEGDEGEEGDDDDVGPIDPPANWPVQEQQFFKELSPQLQHAYLDRARYMTADYTRKTQELAQVRQSYQEMDRIIGPRVQQWALNGMAPAQAMQQLIALSDYATNSPVEFLKYFANLRGVNLNQLAERPELDEYVDPQVSALQKQLAQVQAYVNQSSRVQQQAQQQQQVAQYQQAFNQTNSAIDNFASQTGQDGRPLYPHFKELEEDMAAEIETGRAKTIHEAYERAKWANPFTRSKLLARQRNDENAANRARAQAARRASSSISGASGSYGSPATENMSIRQLLEAASDGQF